MPVNQRGATILTIMTGAAIMATAITGFMMMLDGFRSVTHGLTQKLEILDVQQTLMDSFANPEVCACNFDPGKNSTNGSPLSIQVNPLLPGQSVAMSALYRNCNDTRTAPRDPVFNVGQMLPATQSAMRVTSAVLGNFIASGPAGVYRASLTIRFDASSMKMARHPATLALNLILDESNPAQAHVMKCSTGGVTSTPSIAGSPGSPCGPLPSTGLIFSSPAGNQCCHIGAVSGLPGFFSAACSAL